MPNQTAPQYPGHVVMTRRGETWECPVSYVDRAEEQGWRPVDDNAPATAPAPAPAPKPNPKPGD